MSADTTLRKTVKAHLVAQHVPNLLYQSADKDKGSAPDCVEGSSSSSSSNSNSNSNNNYGSADVGNTTYSDDNGTTTLYTIPMEVDLATVDTVADLTTVYAVPMASDHAGAGASAGEVSGVSNPVYTVPMADDDGGGGYLAIGGSEGNTYHVPTEVLVPATPAHVQQPLYATSADLRTATSATTSGGVGGGGAAAPSAAGGIKLVQIYGQVDGNSDADSNSAGEADAGGNANNYVEANNLLIINSDV